MNWWIAGVYLFFFKWPHKEIWHSNFLAPWIFSELSLHYRTCLSSPYHWRQLLFFLSSFEFQSCFLWIRNWIRYQISLRKLWNIFHNFHHRVFHSQCHVKALIIPYLNCWIENEKQKLQCNSTNLSFSWIVMITKSPLDLVRYS